MYFLKKVHKPHAFLIVVKKTAVIAHKIVKMLFCGEISPYLCSVKKEKRLLLRVLQTG